MEPDRPVPAPDHSPRAVLARPRPSPQPARSPPAGWQAYQDPATGQRIKPGARLEDAYQKAGLPVAKRRLYQAGVKLAMLLNDVFPAD